MKIDELVNRAGTRLFEDGIDELVLGLFLVIYVSALVSLRHLPRDRYSDLTGFSGPLLLGVSAFGIRWLRNQLRHAIVIPRSGYSALPESSTKVRGVRLLFGILGLVSLSLWILPVVPDYPHKVAVMLCVLCSATQSYTGVKYRQPYSVLLGALWIPLGIWTAITHASITLVALTFGSTMVLAGGIKLWRFANSHPVLSERDE